MNERILAATVLALTAGAALADDGQRPIGESTREWIEMQKSPDFTDPSPPAQEGEVSARVYQRYLKSFEHEIPERLSRESIGESD